MAFLEFKNVRIAGLAAGVPKNIASNLHPSEDDAQCRGNKDENERQAESFLQRHPEFEEIPLPETVPEAYRKHRGRGLQLLAYRDGLEGFYLIRMRKKYD